MRPKPLRKLERTRQEWDALISSKHRRLADMREEEWLSAVEWLKVYFEKCSVPCSGNQKCKDVSMGDIERGINKAFNMKGVVKK